MEWEIILALLFAATIVLLPAVLIWYLDIGGIYAAIRKKARFRIPAAAVRIGAVSGLYQVVGDRLRRLATFARRRAVKPVAKAIHNQVA
jgi:hypothetical protein